MPSKVPCCSKIPTPALPTPPYKILPSMQMLTLHQARSGTHTLRKMAYLLAAFGILEGNGHFYRDNVSLESGTSELQLANVLKSARHTLVQNAMMYFKDCGTKWSAIKQEQHPHLNRVGVWESIYIDDYNSFQSISAASHLYKKDISILADYYVTIKHKIPTDGTMTISQVMEAVLFIPTSTDSVGSLLQ
jgi:hypothetical protein